MLLRPCYLCPFTVQMTAFFPLRPSNSTHTHTHRGAMHFLSQLHTPTHHLDFSTTFLLALPYTDFSSETPIVLSSCPLYCLAFPTQPGTSRPLLSFSILPIHALPSSFLSIQLLALTCSPIPHLELNTPLFVEFLQLAFP